MMLDSQPLFALLGDAVNRGQCEKLLAELTGYETSPAGLSHWDGTTGVDGGIRRAAVSDLEDGHWLGRLLFDKVAELNDRLWGMNLLEAERLRILNYEPGGHYLWHFDVLPTLHADNYHRKGTNRVLTVLLNLSDENEYALGELLIKDPVSGERSIGFHGRGSMLVFPSHQLHRATATTDGLRRVAVMWIRGEMDHPDNRVIADFIQATEDVPSPAAATGAVGVPVDDGLVVYRPYTSDLHVLRDTAGWLWEAFSQGLSADVIVANLSSNFGLPEPQLRADIETMQVQWQAANIQPDNSASVARPAASNPADSIQHCYIAGAHIEVVYDAPVVEQMLRPLLAPLETEHFHGVGQRISVAERDDVYRIKTGEGAWATVDTPNRAVLSLLSELQSLATRTGGASLAFGAGALGCGRDAILFPGLLNKGRAALLYALASRFNLPMLAVSCIPMQRASGLLEAMPLPVKLRPLDLELLGDSVELPLDQAVFGTVTDPMYLLPNPVTPANDGRKYCPSMAIIAEYDPDKETTLIPLDAASALQQLMSSGSYFVDDICYEDVVNLSSLVERMPVYSLSFRSIDEAFRALTSVIPDVTVCDGNLSGKVGWVSGNRTGA